MMTVWTRLRFWALLVTDRLLGTHLVDREMVHLQYHIETFAAQVSVLRQRMEDLDFLLHIAQVQMSVLYLRQRYLLRPATWLCFAPNEGPDEEKSLDLLVNRLVRHRLAAVRTEAAGEGNYVYHLRPDWDASENLLSHSQGLDPVTIAWLEEIRRSNIYE